MADAAADPDRAPHPATRLVKGEPSDRVVAVGLPNPWLGDFYHHLLTLPWWAFLVGLAVVYLGLNVLFALLYLLGDGAIANARPGSFADAFFFSVETISTIGYGQMSPGTLYGNIVMTVEAMVGLTLLAVSAGLVLARFTRPTARVLFSKVAVVTPFNGVPTLTCRLANQRRKSSPRGAGFGDSRPRRAHRRGRVDAPFLRSATGTPTQPNFRNDIHGDAPDRRGEPFSECDSIIARDGSGGNRGDSHRSRRDDVAVGSRSYFVPRTRGVVGPPFCRRLHPDQGWSLGRRLSAVPRYRTSAGRLPSLS